MKRATLTKMQWKIHSSCRFAWALAKVIPVSGGKEEKENGANRFSFIPSFVIQMYTSRLRLRNQFLNEAK